MSMPVLTYFSSRGRAELIRLVLAEAGVSYKNHGFAPGKPGELPPEFLALKASGKLAFGAVPMFEETDGTVLVQSDAIVRHLARLHGLNGSDEREATQIDIVYEGIKDLRMSMMRLMTAEPDKRPEIRIEMKDKVLPRWLGHFEQLLSGNAGGAGFFVGNQLSYADLAVWNLLEALDDNNFGSAVDACAGLRAFQQRVQSRPRLAAYLQSAERYPAQKLPG